MLEVSKGSIFKRVYTNSIKHSNLSSSSPTCLRSSKCIDANWTTPMLQQMLLEKQNRVVFQPCGDFCSSKGILVVQQKSPNATFLYILCLIGAISHFFVYTMFVY